MADRHAGHGPHDQVKGLRAAARGLAEPISAIIAESTASISPANDSRSAVDRSSQKRNKCSWPKGDKQVEPVLY